MKYSNDLKEYMKAIGYKTMKTKRDLIRAYPAQKEFIEKVFSQYNDMYCKKTLCIILRFVLCIKNDAFEMFTAEERKIINRNYVLIKKLNKSVIEF